MMFGSRSSGHPVDVATGVVYGSHRDLDIPGQVRLEWERQYSTALLDESPGPLGPGWAVRYFAELHRDGDGYRLILPEGTAHRFPGAAESVESGGVVRHLAAFQELRREGSDYVLTRWDPDTHEVERFLFHGPNGMIGGKLTAVEDATGVGLRLRYDSAGQLQSVHQERDERTIRLFWQSNGRLSEIRLETEAGTYPVVGYTFDASGRLVRVTDPHRGEASYEYDTDNRLTRETTIGGGVFTFEYDDRGRCTLTTGRRRFDWKAFTYFDRIGWTEVKNSCDEVTRFEWRGDGQVVTEQDALGGVRTYEYDDVGRIVGETDPNGARFTYTFDSQGNRARTEDPDGNAISLSFNSAHLPVTMEDARGGLWTRTYDSENRLITSEDPLGNRTTFEYDAIGRLRRFEDPLGNVFTQTFRDEVRQVELADGRGRRVVYTYDDLGRLLSREDPLGARITYGYDPAGNPVKISYPDGTGVEGAWDASGNLTSFSDRCGRTTQVRFGPCGRPLERVDPDGSTTRYTWSTEPGRLLSVRNPAGELYEFHYDEAGRIRREVGFDGRTIEVEYDLAGHRVATTNGNGERIQYRRDALGRLLAQILPDGTSTEFSYDPMGAMLTASNDQIAVSMERDSLGRIVAERQGDRVIRRSYDALGRVASVDADAGPHVSYKRDSVGDLLSIAVDGTTYWSFERDASGREAERRLPGGHRLAQTYLAAGQLSSQRLFLSSGETRRQRDYDYAGPVPIASTDRPGTAVTYEYDDAERLIAQHSTSGPHESFRYDAHGRLAELHHDGTVEALSYGSGGRLVARGETRYEYDANGRLIARAGSDRDADSWRFQWNAVGQLRSVTNEEGKEWKYAYDPFGRLVRKSGPEGTKEFLWDEDTVFREIVEDSSPTTWIFDPDHIRPIGVAGRNGVASFVTDFRGAPYALVDAAGDLIWSAYYRAWGEVSVAEGSTFDCPIRFPGQWYMPETGLHYNRYRYYDPAAGRYISQDPAGLTTGPDLYSYGLNPIRWIDPYGLIDEFVGDSNLFMDRPERASTTRPICDDVLDSPDNTVIVPKAVRNEATANDPRGTQQARLTGSRANVQPVRSSNVAQILRDHPDILSRNFDENDLKLMQTARMRGLPVVTNNRRMRNQIQSHATRRALFGNVRIIVVGEDISSASDLECL